jgi:hypothetical protein
MIENRYQFNIKKGEKVFTLNFAVDSTLGELFDVVSEIKNDIINRIKQNEEEEKKMQQPKVEPIEEKKDV